MGNDNGTELTSLYRTSVHGTTYDDLLDSVGDAEPLVFVIRKDKYVFGVHINCGLELPDDPTDYNDYECDVRWFSLAGHFAKPTKIDAREMYQGVDVMVAGHSAGGVSVMIGGYRRLGGYLKLDELYRWVPEDGWVHDGDIRNCAQYTTSSFMPAGYTGESSVGALLGGSYRFHADEIEVLQAPFISSPTISSSATRTCVCLWLSLFLFCMSFRMM